jgi:predicted ATPase
MKRRGRVPESHEPFLRRIRLLDPPSRKYPFSLPIFSEGLDLDLRTKVTLFVGENGSGKSTLLEGIAGACGFGAYGGSRDHSAETEASELAGALRLSWLPKVTAGFFFRAESFFNFSAHIDELGDQDRYGGERALLAQSHGESFLALFRNRFEEGLFILDEPEAALSPQRQLALIRIISDLERSGRSQFLIATHSPILLMYPGAVVLSLDGNTPEEVRPEETEHVRLTRDFLLNTELYLRSILATTDE